MVEMVILVEMAILGSVISVQREVNGTVQWLSFRRNIGGGSSLYTWRGAWCLMLLFPV